MRQQCANERKRACEVHLTVVSVVSQALETSVPRHHQHILPCCAFSKAGPQGRIVKVVFQKFAKDCSKSL